MVRILKHNPLMVRFAITWLIPFLCTIPIFANPKLEVWKSIPRGANVFSGISDTDLDFAKSRKMRLLRLGAVGQHEDLRWLIANDRFDLSEKNLARLRSLISKMTKRGFFVVLALSELPGRRWRFGEKDYRIWQNPKFQDEFVRGWKELARFLKSEEGVIGLELINEPYLREGQSSSQLNALYSRAIEAIRAVDVDVPIILQPAKMGSLDELENLSNFKEKNLIYSFHYYEPWVYFAKRKNQGRLSYPGEVPRWSTARARGPVDFWNLKHHKDRLAIVKDWAERRGLKPHQIFVGEFGVWKDAKGADLYLQDVLSIFSQMGWPWAYYAFREVGWDNANLELGPLDEKTGTPKLFEIVHSQL